MIRRLSFLLLLSAMLSACSVAPEKSIENYQLADMQHLQQQKNWSFEGRLALVSDKESVSVSINWRHAESHDEIELVGPLAQGRVKISVSPGQVEVDDGDVRNIYYGQADAMLSEQLGMDIPVSSLRFWVLGVNDPGYAFVEQSGGFYQNGWLVRYKEMQNVNANILPKKMTAEKDKARVKLIVDQWVLS